MQQPAPDNTSSARRIGPSQNHADQAKDNAFDRDTCKDQEGDHTDKSLSSYGHNVRSSQARQSHTQRTCSQRKRAHKYRGEEQPVQALEMSPTAFRKGRQAGPAIIHFTWQRT
jgi:hypothetical protein